MSEFEDAIRFEVALEVLGQGLQPFIMAIEEEAAKSAPCAAWIGFCQARIQALTRLQDALRPHDKELIERILNPHNTLGLR